MSHSLQPSDILIKMATRSACLIAMQVSLDLALTLFDPVVNGDFRPMCYETDWVINLYNHIREPS